MPIKIFWRNTAKKSLEDITNNELDLLIQDIPRPSGWKSNSGKQTKISLFLNHHHKRSFEWDTEKKSLGKLIERDAPPTVEEMNQASNMFDKKLKYLGDDVKRNDGNAGNESDTEDDGPPEQEKKGPPEQEKKPEKLAHHHAYEKWLADYKEFKEGTAAHYKEHKKYMKQHPKEAEEFKKRITEVLKETKSIKKKFAAELEAIQAQYTLNNEKPPFYQLKDEISTKKLKDEMFKEEVNEDAKPIQTQYKKIDKKNIGKIGDAETNNIKFNRKIDTKNMHEKETEKKIKKWAPTIKFSRVTFKAFKDKIF